MVTTRMADKSANDGEGTFQILFILITDDLHFLPSLEHYIKLTSFMAIMGRAIRAIMTIFPNYGHKDHYGQINMAINEACLNQ